jgi:hypothetical protein
MIVVVIDIVSTPLLLNDGNIRLQAPNTIDGGAVEAGTANQGHSHGHHTTAATADQCREEVTVTIDHHAPVIGIWSGASDMRILATVDMALIGVDRHLILTLLEGLHRQI